MGSSIEHPLFVARACWIVVAIACVPILLFNSAARNLVRNKKSFNLPSVMQTETRVGMTTMTQSLINLYKAGKIDGPTMVQAASNKERAREVMLKDTGLDASQPAFMKSKE